MDFKKEFLQYVLNANDDEKNQKFKELKKKIRSGDSEAKELLEFLTSYEDVSIRYFAKKIREQLRKDKDNEHIDLELEATEILKKLDDSQHFSLNHEKEKIRPINTEALKKYLNASDYKKRIKAVEGAGMMGDPQAIPIIINFLENEKHPFVKATMVKVLGTFKDSLVIPVISMYLSDKDNRVRANAIEGLEMIEDPKAVEHVIPLLQDPEHRVRATAAKMLVKFGRKDVMEVLKKMLDSPLLWLQESAIYALGEIGTHECFEFLKDKYFSTSNEEVKLSIIKAIQKLSRTPEINSFLRNAYSNIRDKNSVLGLLIEHLLGTKHKNTDKTVNVNNIMRWIVPGILLLIVIIGVFFYYQNVFKNNSNSSEQPKVVVSEKNNIKTNPSEKISEPVSKDKEALKQALSELTPEDENTNTKIENVTSPVVEEKASVITSEVKKALVPKPTVKPVKTTQIEVAVKTPDSSVPNLPSDENTLQSKEITSNVQKKEPKKLENIIEWAKKKYTDEVNVKTPKMKKKKVLSLDEKLSLWGVDKNKKALILKKLKIEKKRIKPKILFLYPENNNLAKSMNIYSKGIADFLISNFSKIPGVEVISRDDLQSKMLELGLTIRDLGTKDIALKMGEIFNVDYVVYGKIKEIGSNFSRYYKEFIQNEPQDDDATKVYIEGKLDEGVFEDIIAESLPSEFTDSRELIEEIAHDIYYNVSIDYIKPGMDETIRREILKRFYNIGMDYYEQHDYRKAVQYFKTAKTINKSTGNPFEDLDSHLKLAEKGIERLNIRNRDKIRDSVIIEHIINILDLSTRKELKKIKINKKLVYFRDILKNIYNNVYEEIGLPKKRLPDKMLFNGFTNDLEAFLRLYDSIDLMDIDIGDTQVENREDRVLTLLNKCLIEDNNYADAYYYRAKIYALENNIDKALKEAEQASMLDPSNIRMRYSIVMYRKKLGDNKGAKIELKNISKLKSVEYRSVLSKSHLELAYHEYGIGNIDRCLNEIQNALIADPDSPDAFLALGLFMLRKKEYSKSLLALEEADKHVSSVYIKLIMTTILYKMEDIDGMLTKLKQALMILNKDKHYYFDGKYQFMNFDKAPKYPKNAVYYYLGLSFWKKQSKDLARTYFRQCIGMEAHNEYAYKARTYLEQ